MNKFEDPNKYESDDINSITNIVKHTCSIDHEPLRISGGCGRIYLWIGYKNLRSNSKLAKALVANGHRVTQSPGSSGRMVYIGYDNARGDVAAKAEAIVKALKAWDASLPCGVDYQAD